MTARGRLREAIARVKQAARYVPIGDGYFDPWTSAAEAVDEAVDDLAKLLAEPGGDWVLVPRNLSDEMLEAVVRLDMTARHDPLWPEYWSAMLAAAPAPPTDRNAAADELAEAPYLIWSNEHQAWWGVAHRGYTRIIDSAGRYSRAEALSIAGTRDGGWHVRKSNPDEIAMPEQDAIDQYAAITRYQQGSSK